MTNSSRQINMKCLVTGGAGYIGSHVVLQLVKSGYNVVVVDNLCNSSVESLRRVSKLTNVQLKCYMTLCHPVSHGEEDTRLQFYLLDLLDVKALSTVFNRHNDIISVIHLAGLKSVPESFEDIMGYSQTNVVGTLNLVNCMLFHNVRRIVYSSSASVYSQAADSPIKESSKLFAASPYGANKIAVETLLQEMVVGHKWRVAILRLVTCLHFVGAKSQLNRYFNPIGAHESGILGEDPRSKYLNILPVLNRVVKGKQENFSIFGTDYNTTDGTAVRDYIHVVDVAHGHLAVLKKLEGSTQDESGVWIYNLGSGCGYSVLQVLEEFKKACGKSIPISFSPRRAGDSPSLIADPSLANQDLKWKAEKTLAQMCADFWKWTTMNPNGYENTINQ
jgi:UDP-glucose 4-epimerase